MSYRKVNVSEQSSVLKITKTVPEGKSRVRARADLIACSPCETLRVTWS
jgi:hypothetical protein